MASELEHHGKALILTTTLFPDRRTTRLATSLDIF
jgi:hypothetical protein